MLNWLKSKIRPSYTPKAEPMRVRMTEDSVEVLMDETVQRTVKLADIKSVKIVTTYDGPCLSDVFFILETGENPDLPIAQDLEGAAALGEYITALPGADMAAFITAMGSTTPNLFPIWSRNDG